MMTHLAKHCIRLLFCLCSPVLLAVDAIATSEPLRDASNWIVEQMPGGTVNFADGRILISDKAGCTVWYRHKITAPVKIVFKAAVRSSGRISDLNCFWMASDPRSPENLFHKGHERTGRFSTYDSLQTYYVGYGGNANSTTRFRRYAGGGARPLLEEHDLRDEKFLLKADHVYTIEITVAKGTTTYARDGETIFRYSDPTPLTSGWFGFRTVDSVIEVSGFEVIPLSDGSVTGK